MDKILITTSSFGEEDSISLKKMEDAGYKVILNPYKRKLSEEEITQLVIEHQPIGIIAGVEPLTRNVLKKAICLKVISRCGIGMDSVDLNSAREFGIVVTNTPDAPTIPVAELTLGMILTLLRQLHIVDASIRQGKWERPMGLLLHGKTVGIIGCGRIGSYLAKLLQNFGATLMGYDQYVTCHDICQMVPLDELLAKADIVTLHIPYTEENHYFLNAEKLALMKKGAMLINAARGGLIDEIALFELLESGHIAGAALDCYENEPYVGELKELSNVLLLCHIGSYAKEGRILMEKQAMENLLNKLVINGNE